MTQHKLPPPSLNIYKLVFYALVVLILGLAYFQILTYFILGQGRSHWGSLTSPISLEYYNTQGLHNDDKYGSIHIAENERQLINQNPLAYIENFTKSMKQDFAQLAAELRNNLTKLEDKFLKIQKEFEVNRDEFDKLFEENRDMIDQLNAEMKQNSGLMDEKSSSNSQDLVLIEPQPKQLSLIEQAHQAHLDFEPKPGYVTQMSRNGHVIHRPLENFDAKSKPETPKLNRKKDKFLDHSYESRLFGDLEKQEENGSNQKILEVQNTQQDKIDQALHNAVGAEDAQKALNKLFKQHMSHEVIETEPDQQNQKFSEPSLKSEENFPSLNSETQITEPDSDFQTHEIIRDHSGEIVSGSNFEDPHDLVHHHNQVSADKMTKRYMNRMEEKPHSNRVQAREKRLREKWGDEWDKHL